MLQRDRSSESIDEARGARTPLLEEHAFGTHVVRHDFSRVDGLHTGVGESKSDSEYCAGPASAS